LTIINKCGSLRFGFGLQQRRNTMKNLIVVCFSEKGSIKHNLDYFEVKTTQEALENRLVEGVEVPLFTIEGDNWYFLKGSSFEERHTTGRSVRVPRSASRGFWWGPMMVIDPTNKSHLEALENAMNEFHAGIMSKAA